MLQKQVYDLTRADLERFPVWYFPMDVTVEDELTVRPLPIDMGFDTNFQIIVRTRFASKDGGVFLGYIYWGYPHDVSYLKPVMYVSDCCVTFWNGSIKPSDDYLNGLSKHVPELFPVSFESEETLGLSPISGVLEGIYFKVGGEVTCVLPKQPMRS